MPTRLEQRLAEALGAAEAEDQKNFEGQDAVRRYCDANRERLTKQARAALTALLKMAEESGCGFAPSDRQAIQPKNANTAAFARAPCTGQITVGPEGLANGRYVTINTPKLDPISKVLRAFGYADRREVRHLQMRQIAPARRMPMSQMRA